MASVLTTVEYNTADLTATGNYFEVEILTPGTKDIGIGLILKTLLPNQTAFSLTNNLPGCSVSYGYHGDDGNTCGPGRKEVSWPKWDTGDVIGCGLDTKSGENIIFYTRNGKLLGIAFQGVPSGGKRRYILPRDLAYAHSHCVCPLFLPLVLLCPVVGFQKDSNGLRKQVQINFGAKPFRYKGIGGFQVFAHPGNLSPGLPLFFPSA